MPFPNAGGGVAMHPFLKQKLLSGLGGPAQQPGMARPPAMPPPAMAQLSAGRNINRVSPIRAPFGKRVAPHMPHGGGMKIPRFGGKG